MSLNFSLVFVGAAAFWLLMILAPGWRWTHRIVSSPWIVAPTLVFWFLLAIPRMPELLPAVARPTLEAWQELVTDPAVLTGVWAQIIAWDLFVGRWIYLDSRERGVSPLIVSPLLVLAIMLSPIAMPLYLVVRHIAGRKPPESRPVAAAERAPASA